MSEQLGLFGDADEAPRPRKAPAASPAGPPRTPDLHAVFFALRPSKADATRFVEAGRRLCVQHRLAGSVLTPERLHVSLHGVGAYAGTRPRELVEVAAYCARQVQAATGAIDVVFDRALTFGRRDAPSDRKKAFVLRNSMALPALERLHTALGAAMKTAGLRVSRSITPHMTLTYDRRVVEEHPVEPLAWTAMEFVLVDSHQGHGIHEVLERWPLAA